MKKTMAIITLSIILTSCSSEKKTELKVSVISESENHTLNRSSLKVTLSMKVDTSVLKDVANQLRSNRTNYDRLNISYYLTENDTNKQPWAITNFEPLLRTEILGTTEDQEVAMKELASSVQGNIIGQWKEDHAVGMLVTITEDSTGNVFLNTVWKTGSDFEFAMDKTTTKDGKLRFDYTEEMHGEYFILESNGNLGLYGKAGKFSEAEKL